jgi:hypothetical protein
MNANVFRRIADRARAIPAKFGLREHTVTLITRLTSGAGLPWDAPGIEKRTPITVSGGAAPKVRFPSQREIALGMMSMGSVVIGPFTPDYGSGGIDRSLFDGSQMATGDGLLIEVTGPQFPSGARFRSKNINLDRALHVTMVCNPVDG